MEGVWDRRKASGEREKKEASFHPDQKRDRGEPGSFGIKTPKLLLHTALKSTQDTWSRCGIWGQHLFSFHYWYKVLLLFKKSSSWEGFLVPHTAVRERLPTSAWEAAASQGMLARLWKTASSVSCSSGISAGTESHCLADSRYPRLDKHAGCSQWNRRQMQIGCLRPIPDSHSHFTALAVWIQI